MGLRDTRVARYFVEVGGVPHNLPHHFYRCNINRGRSQKPRNNRYDVVFPEHFEKMQLQIPKWHPKICCALAHHSQNGSVPIRSWSPGYQKGGSGWSEEGRQMQIQEKMHIVSQACDSQPRVRFNSAIRSICILDTEGRRLKGAHLQTRKELEDTGDEEYREQSKYNVGGHGRLYQRRIEEPLCI